MHGREKAWEADAAQKKEKTENELPYSELYNHVSVFCVRRAPMIYEKKQNKCRKSAPVVHEVTGNVALEVQPDGHIGCKKIVRAIDFVLVSATLGACLCQRAGLSRAQEPIIFSINFSRTATCKKKRQYTAIKSGWEQEGGGAR